MPPHPCAAADQTFATLNKKLETRMDQLRKSRSGVDEADLELEASNRLYEEYLEQAGAIVAQNKGILQGPAISDWTQKQSSALYFANEAYHTSGPVESTVIGQQMGIAMKQVAEQHLQAINEQTGFVIEQHENGFVAQDPEEGEARPTRPTIRTASSTTAASCGSRRSTWTGIVDTRPDQERHRPDRC